MSQRRFTPQKQQRNPKDRGPKPPFEEPGQSFPGLEEKMRSKPDHGEESYRGNGRLQGKTALITGGDSGIGRAVAIAFAREGADVVLSCLPEEKAEAQDAAGWIEKAGRKAFTLPGDLQDQKWCRTLVERSIEEFGKLDILVKTREKRLCLRQW